MKIRLMLLTASALLVTSCDAGNEATNDTSTAAAATTNSAADQETIQGQVARWHELIKAKDAAAIAQLYIEDGAVMPPNAPIGKGRAAIEQTWAGLLAIPGFELQILPEEITVSDAGDMALDRGTYQLTIAPSGKTINDTGKYVVVWRKVDGEWKAAADIFNSDLPAG